MAQKLSVRLAADPASSVPLLQRAERFAVLGESLREAVAGEALFELIADGELVGAFTLGVRETASGRQIHCGAAGGRPGFDLVGTMTRFAEHEAQRIGAGQLVTHTKRRGLVRRLEREGYRVAGFILTKETA
ncbi:hypothetical protein ACNI65_09980 [Roseateles sp. So40a]|uniref:hypothetical protein n=1 Tax=Roseateles sp. So40a TaxID=3400226 RepID=UPI003A869E3B